MRMGAGRLRPVKLVDMLERSIGAMPRVRPGLRRPSDFAGLWISVAASAFGRMAIQLALSWITLEVTGSVFMVGVVAAMRMAPQVPLGIPAGMGVDWVQRKRLLVGISAPSSLVAFGISALAASGW